MSTFHTYYAAVTEELYEEYGQIESLLCMRGIFSTGVEYKEPFRAEDGNVYHHMLVVYSGAPIENLHELFPGVTTQWTHKEEERAKPSDKMPQLHTKMKHGKLHASTDKITFRI